LISVLGLNPFLVPVRDRSQITTRLTVDHGG
jgi:hypothetical protein